MLLLLDPACMRTSRARDARCGPGRLHTALRWSLGRLRLAIPKLLDPSIVLTHAFARGVMMARATDVPVAEGHARLPGSVVPVSAVGVPRVVIAVAQSDVAARGRTVSVVPARVGIEPRVVAMYHHRIGMVMPAEIEVIERPVRVDQRVDVNPCRWRVVGALVINACSPVPRLGIGRAAGQHEAGEQSKNETAVESFHDHCHAISSRVNRG